MIITLPSGKTAKLIGDPHLGKKFEAGVPPHRRGEREKNQLAHLGVELDTQGVDYNIMVGDLFDHPYVGYGVVLDAAQLFLYSAVNNPGTRYYAMAGNHDVPRNVGAPSAWDAFVKIIQDRLPNLEPLTHPFVGDDFIALPWQWGVSAVEQLEWDYLKLGKRQVAIGHWDLKSFGGDDSHLAPTQELAALGITEIYGGHYHTPGDYTVAGLTVRCTGSLEPYSHAEDPTGDTYVTMSLLEIKSLQFPDMLKDKCVRVALRAGEEMPELDCLSLTPMRINDPAEATEVVSLGAFDWKTTLDEALRGLDEEVRTFIMDRLTG